MAHSKNRALFTLVVSMLPAATIACGNGGGDDSTPSLVDKGGNGPGGSGTGGGSAGALVLGTGGSNGGSGARDGGSTSGGTSSAGGAAPRDGAAGAGACTAVTFHMDNGGPPPGSRFCSGPPNCAGGFPLTILDNTGAAITDSLLCAQADCSTCLAAPCPPGSCHFSSPLPAAGQDLTWSGIEYSSGGSCQPTKGGGGKVACYVPECAPAGHYVARLCAYALAANSDGGTQVCELHASPTATCVDVPFDYPATTHVVGVLDPRK